MNISNQMFTSRGQVLDPIVVHREVNVRFEIFTQWLRHGLAMIKLHQQTLYTFDGCFTHLEDLSVLQDHSSTRFGLIVTRIGQISALEQEFSHFSKKIPVCYCCFSEKSARLKKSRLLFLSTCFANFVQDTFELFQDKFSKILMQNQFFAFFS